MTHQAGSTLPSELLEQIPLQRFEFLPNLIRILTNAAMQAERQKYLKATPHQRSEEHHLYANGYKPKTVQTPPGGDPFDIPQVRKGGFFPKPWRKTSAANVP
jgi:putative transposase